MKREAAVLAASGCVGLFIARILNEFVPDALGIGIALFAAGALGGFVAGVTTRKRHDEAAKLVGAALERGKGLAKRLGDD